MTVTELYNLAKEHGAEDLSLRVCVYNHRADDIEDSLVHSFGIKRDVNSNEKSLILYLE